MGLVVAFEYHLDVAESLDSLATLYRHQGRYAQAEPLYLRSLAIKENTLGSDHLDVTKILSGLAVLYIDQGKYRKAEPLFQRSLATREKILGGLLQGTLA